MLDASDHKKIHAAGRAMVNVLDGIFPEPESKNIDRAGQLIAADLLRRAVFRRFGVTEIEIAPIVAPDRPPSGDDR